MQHALDTIVAKLHLLNHPFYQRWMDGTLTKTELKEYAKNYMAHVEAFPRYVSAVHANCEDAKTRQALLENLIEEERGEENHPELWRRFAEAVGVPRDELNAHAPLAEAQALVTTFRDLTQASFASGLGALYAYESQVPAIAQQKIDGLEKNYGIEDERGLRFFNVHREADAWHSAVERDAYDALTTEGKAEADRACATATRALWNFLSGLDRAHRPAQAA